MQHFLSLTAQSMKTFHLEEELNREKYCNVKLLYSKLYLRKTSNISLYGSLNFLYEGTSVTFKALPKELTQWRLISVFRSRV